MSESDLVLFERWRQGRDAEAFAELVSRYADMVYATCRRVTGDAVAAEDVTQECFLKLAEGRAQVHRSVAGWLHSLATCRSLDRLRGEARRRRLEERFAGEALEPVAVDWEDLRPHIDAAIEDLPERLREVVVRHFLHGETHAEVAARLGVSRPAVTKSIGKGVERIRVFLRRRGIAVSAVVLAELVADGVVEAAPESVRVSLGKLALSGVPEGAPIAVVTGMSLAIKVAAVAGGIALVIAVYVGFHTRLANVPPRLASSAAPQTSAVSGREATQSQTPVTASPQASVAPVRTSSTTERIEPVTATVRGLVRAGEMEPLAGATVEVRCIDRVPGLPRKPYSALTSEDGTYEVTGIETSGKVVVRASSAGYVDSVEDLDLLAGDVQDHVDFKLPVGTTLTGQVLSSSGAPVPGALVTYTHWSEVGSDVHLFGGKRGYLIPCDEKGIFQIGLYRKTVDDDTERMVESIDIVAPGHEAGHFSNVTLPVGEVVPFQLQAPATIRGRVMWKDGSPAVGYVVRAEGCVEDAQRSSRSTAPVGCVVGADGAYEIGGLAPGLPYHVKVERLDGREVPGTQQITTDPRQAGSVFEWNPVMTRPIRVTGRLYAEGSKEPFSHYQVLAIGKIENGPSGYRDENADGGEYELLISRAGSYWIYPDYELSFHEEGSLKPYGKQVEVHEGDDLRVDLYVPKPYLFPVRVVDTQGKPCTKAELRQCRISSDQGREIEVFNVAKLDADGRYTWFCMPGKEVWFTATTKGCHAESTARRIGVAGFTAQEETLVLKPFGGLKANIVVPDGVKLKGGVLLRVANLDGTVEDMLHTVFFCVSSAPYLVSDCVPADRISVTAVEVDVDEPHMSQTVECTVAPGEIYDLGDLVMR
ncbi:MAG: sigma-70 family RNA polymerase sigma factor [FCB group bacterium]|nr:sigma-70 family RNA polymerase sigma factor [FCB group bacterium]